MNTPSDSGSSDPAASTSGSENAHAEGLARAWAQARAAGPLAWIAKNTVAANVFMAILLIGGLVMLLGGRIRQEVFPEVDLDLITVNVPYPGASPEEVEQGVLLVIEGPTPPKSIRIASASWCATPIWG